MRQFKLIKTYPGYPTLGVTAHQCTEVIRYEIKNLVGTTISFEYTGHIENCPDYWQEFVEKDFEILSFIHDGTHGVQKGTIVKMKDGKLDSEHQNLDESHYLAAKVWSIHSVKRLSDGQIFTIYDKVKILNSLIIYKITSMKLTESNRIYVVGIEDNTPNRFSSFGQDLANLIKVKQLFFKTEDNVDIFEGMNYFTVYIMNDKRYNTWVTQAKPFVANGKPENYVHDDVKYFSTQTAAEEYILLNKPCLSVTEVMNAGYGICNPHALLSIVNSKINEQTKN